MKITFFLKSKNKGELPDFCAKDSKLTAHQILRVEKVCKYVVDNLKLKIPNNNPPIKPEEFIEITANDHLLKPTDNLATAKMYFRDQQSGNLTLFYGLKRK